MYITYEEYIASGEYTDIPQDEFNKLEKKAGLVLDSLTRFFYKNRSLEDDVEFRREAFKMAMVEQIDYFYGNSLTKVSDLTSNGEYASVTIGRTSQSLNTAANGSNPRSKETSEDVLLYLRGTGLLYRGLGRC